MIAAPASDTYDIKGLLGLNPEGLSLSVELDQYRRLTEWLSVMNELHRRLSGAVDLSGMIEAFSIWLMPFVEHDLLAYHNYDRNRGHKYCSCHGQDRQKAERAVEKVLDKISSSSDHGHQYEDGFHIKKWDLKSYGEKGRLLVLSKNRGIESHESYLIGKAIEVLKESLRRALDYEDLFDLANRDALTGLANRRVFEDRIGPLLDASRRHNHPICLGMMDLDNFKQINDALGHAQGDEVLKIVAATLSKMIRSDDLLVRMGGDEFMMVLPNTELSAAENLAERLRAAIERQAIQTPSGVKLGISIGLAQWHNGLSRKEWIQIVDETLYKAKASGRSRVCSHWPKI